MCASCYQDNVMDVTANLELRHLPLINRTELINILQVKDSWRCLIEIIPKDSSEQPKFTAEHVRLIESASSLQKRPCSEILLEEWGTMGRKRPNLQLLLQLLTKAELLRAADYVASIIGEHPVERPAEGPAAPICTSAEMSVIANRNSPMGTKAGNSTESDSSHSEQTVIERKVEYDDCNTNPAAHLRETEPVGGGIPKVETDCLVLKFDQLRSATGDFSETNKLGAGAFGAVYSCIIAGQKVAVKKFNNEEDINLQSQFLNEVKSLKRYKHKNLLPLIGYSCDSHLCIVYELMPNGCLQGQLALKDQGKILLADRRLQIAIGSAEGIHYLHSAFEKPLIHRDVKTANILLDAHLSPKLGDFGLVRSVNSGTSVSTTTAIGTSAYMAPEAFRGDISIKMDTYSFGVVLLELLSGLPPYDEDREGCDLVTHFEDLRMEEIVEVAAKWEHAKASALYQLAHKCLENKKASRPNMGEVLGQLRRIEESSPTNNFLLQNPGTVLFICFFFLIFCL